jgi:threonine dehydratase
MKRVSLDEIRAAAANVADLAMRTPLVRLRCDTITVAAAAAKNVRVNVLLKLENMQPIGSFKVRGAGNGVRCLSKVCTSVDSGDVSLDALSTTARANVNAVLTHKGVVTASAGNSM